MRRLQQGEVETAGPDAVVDHDEAAGTPCNLSAELRNHLPGFLFPYHPPRPLSAASTVTSRLDHRRRSSTTTKLPVLRATSRPSCQDLECQPPATCYMHRKKISQRSETTSLSLPPSVFLGLSLSVPGEVETGSEAEVVDHDDAAAATPCNLSAELRYEAPLATFDGDEWTEFLLDAPPDNNHFRSPVDDVTSGGGSGEFVETWSGSLEDLVNTFDSLDDRAPSVADLSSSRCLSFCLSVNMVMRPSVVDVSSSRGLSICLSVCLSVNTFDARITACFRNYNEHVRRAACCWLWPRPGPPRIRYAYFRLYRR